MPNASDTVHVSSPPCRKTGDMLARASALLEGGGRQAVEEAAGLITHVLDAQDLDADGPRYGQVPMQLPGSPGDLNAALFRLPLLASLDARRHSLPAEIAHRLHVAAEAMVTAAERRWDEELFDPHRDGLAYSNVTLLQVRALAIGSRITKQDRLRRRAVATWRRWLHRIALTGVDEFLSPTYGAIVLETLRELPNLLADPQSTTEIARVQSHLAAIFRAVTHPILEVPVCGMSRSYRRSFLPGHAPAWSPELARLPSPSDEPHRYPRRAAGRATAVPFRWTSFQQPAWGLGSFTGGHYFWQQIQLVAAAGTSRDARDLCWMPAAPTPTPGFVAQRDGTALCLFSRTAATLHATQWAGRTESPRERAGSYGVAVAGRWQLLAQTDGGYRLSSPDGPMLWLLPFVLREGGVQACRLEERSPLPSLHALPADTAPHRAYLFPEEPEQIGLVASFDALPTALPVHCAAGRHHTLQAGRLTLAWTVLPDGRMVEQYDDDWRTAPILQSPELTLYPGDLLQQRRTV